MQNLRKQIGPVNIETKSQTHKKQQIKQEAKASNSFATSHSSRYENYKMLPARINNVNLSSF